MRYLVTGAAGFVGSHLADRLVADGDEVVAVDCFTDYYDTSMKQANAQRLAREGGVTVDRRDLSVDVLDDLVDGVDAILHLAGQPGVRLSWADHFELYVAGNLTSTQRLLEAACRMGVKRLVLASSSSVYGNADSYPTSELAPTHPFSPYGVSKLAAESLCRAYAGNWGITTTALRYFTVYGPRQRPDMAFYRFIESALDGDPLVVYGDGTQVRDFTYVGDVVDATVRAAARPLQGSPIINVAGGSSAQLNDVLDTIGEVTGRPVTIDRQPAQPGDVRVTGGDTSRAAELLGWRPAVSLAEGISRQVAWHVERRAGR